MKHYFHFALGPVQDFVVQARRTRDFWAGSFLLSWLATVAMRAVRAQSGTILFPQPNEHFLQALETTVENPPTQGGIPNRFKAEVGEVFDPERVVESVRTAWRELAEAVWCDDLQDFSDEQTRTIWERQISGFWEMQWVLTDDVANSNCIDRMKNWRTHLPAPEPRLKCMMMDGWQELSGAERPNDKKSETFWNLLGESGKKGMKTDLRPGEQLCAIAFVKRRFVRVFEGLSVVMPSGWVLKGWKLPASVPSVQYMAAAPWLAELIRKASEDKDLAQQMWNFHDAATRLIGGHGEWESNIRCVREAPHTQRKWAALDGGVFFDSMLENSNLWGEQKEAALSLLGKLKNLHKQADLGPVSPFYAILRMDGDELGKQMSDSTKQQAITAGLARFADNVQDIVYRHNGFLIYAGGDDVLALVTLEDALALSASLRAHYMDCFDGSGIRTSVSAAIEYVHFKMPLAKALDDSHHLLDDTAKDATGRDALAVRIWKPGGIAAVWSMPWDKALDPDGAAKKLKTVKLDRLAQAFQNTEREAEGMSSKFFYGLRERFAVLNPPAGEAAVLDDAQQCNLLVMQFLNSGVNRETWTPERARTHLAPLLEQCRVHRRVRKDECTTEIITTPGVLKVDGALLLRFLAQKGVEIR